MMHALTKGREKRCALRSLIAAATVALSMLAAGEVKAAEIARVEVTPPPTAAGTNAAGMRDVAAAELEQIDVSRLPDHRRVVVSIAVTRATADRTIACTVNAMLRDAQTGAMLAIIEAGAQSEGPPSLERRKEVAHAAVRSAVRRIPKALGGK